MHLPVETAHSRHSKLGVSDSKCRGAETDVHRRNVMENKRNLLDWSSTQHEKENSKMSLHLHEPRLCKWFYGLALQRPRTLNSEIRILQVLGRIFFKIKLGFRVTSTLPNIES